VAAHPDDETIGAARLLLAARDACVVHVTDGAPHDPALRPGGPGDRAGYARARRDEAEAALAIAGLGPADVACLGAADQEAANEIGRLALALAELLGDERPAAVVTHPLEGGHPDHDAAAVATRAALELLRRRGSRPPRLLEMTSYHWRDGRLVTGAFLPGGPEGVVRALGEDERRAKRRMLDRYETQRDMLAPFGVDAERYRVAPPLDLARPPHERPLLYESLGWTTWMRFAASARAGLEAIDLATFGLDAGPR
jgi:LmbE family N-acetylglucosaminyl deacetylase